VNPQSWNRYSYVENDPIHNVDPLGLLIAPRVLEPDPCCPLAVAAAARRRLYAQRAATELHHSSIL
jgi:uncharacterized protein RhaS with RHS repeats